MDDAGTRYYRALISPTRIDGKNVIARTAALVPWQNLTGILPRLKEWPIGAMGKLRTNKKGPTKPNTKLLVDAVRIENLQKMHRRKEKNQSVRAYTSMA